MFVRLVSLLLFLVGCGFQPGAALNDAETDAPADALVDGTAMVTWDVDSTSHKAVPSTTQQWADLISQKQLTIAPPMGLWLMQDTSGALVDSIGTVMLAPSNASASNYHHAVPGWTRDAIATIAGQNIAFGNNNNPSLPDVSSKSMTVLLYYATESIPFAESSIVFAGSGGVNSLAEVGIDTAGHYKFTVHGTATTGTISHGPAVVPVVLELDHTHGLQQLTVGQETFSPAYAALNSSTGLLLAAANHTDPEGRWLYMAAWYDSAAEMTTAQVSDLLTSLGW